MDKEELRDLVPDVYEEEKRIIKQAERQGKLVLFVGAGVSMASGLPSWSDLIREIAIRMKEYIGNNDKEDKEYLETLKSSIKTIESELSGKAINDDNNVTSALKSVNKTTSYIEKIIDEKDKLSLDPLIIPQYYYNKYGKHDYNELIYKILKKNEYIKTNSLHKLIYRFNCSHIITTNYDTLLEEAAKEAHEFVYIIKQDKDVAYRTGEKEIIKMHGDFTAPYYVLKEDDYLEYNDNFKLIENYVKSLIAGNVVLFLGFSFSDQNLKHIFSWLRTILKEDMQHAFIIFTGDGYSQIQEEYLKNMGINALYASKKFNNEKESHNEQLEKMLGWIQDKSVSKDVELKESIKELNGFNYIYSNYLQNYFKQLGFIDSDCLNLHDKDLFEKNEKEIISLLRKSIVNIISYRIINWQQKNTFNDVEVSHINLFNEIYKSIILFDKDSLIDVKNKLELDKENNLLAIAYINFILGDYIKTNNYLLYAAKKFYSEYKPLWYFISCFNRKMLSNLRYDQNFEKEAFEKINKEVSKIDLHKILVSFPNINYHSNNYISDLVDFTLPYKVLAKMNSIAEKVNNEANTCFGLYVGEPSFSKLREMVRDYYDYISLNYIFIGKFQEHIEIFQHYSKVILQSMLTPRKFVASNQTMFDYDGGNIKIEKLSPFDLFVILNYMKVDDLENLITNNVNAKNILFDDNCIGYLTDLLKVKTYIPCAEKSYIFQDIAFLEKIVLLLNVNNLNDTIIQLMLFQFEKLNGINDLNKIKYNFMLNYFFNTFREYFNNKQDFASEQEIVEVLNKYILKLLSDNLKGFLLSDYALDSCLQIYCKYKNKYIDSIINELIFKDKYQALSIVYDYLSEEYKKKIKDNYQEWLFVFEEDNSVDKYFRLVNSDIVTSKSEIEEKLVEKLNEIIAENKISKCIKINYLYIEDKSKENIINTLVNLLINNKIINKNKVIETLENQESSNTFIKWLIKIKDFDYDTFDLNWLKSVSVSFLEDRVFVFDEVKVKLKNMIKDKYLKNENIDTGILNIYFKYLA